MEAALLMIMIARSNLTLATLQRNLERQSTAIFSRLVAQSVVKVHSISNSNFLDGRSTMMF